MLPLASKALVPLSSKESLELTLLSRAQHFSRQRQSLILGLPLRLSIYSMHFSSGWHVSNHCGCLIQVDLGGIKLAACSGLTSTNSDLVALGLIEPITLIIEVEGGKDPVKGGHEGGNTR